MNLKTVMRPKDSANELDKFCKKDVINLIRKNY